jgi:hypothetical protein
VGSRLPSQQLQTLGLLEEELALHFGSQALHSGLRLLLFSRWIQNRLSYPQLDFQLAPLQQRNYYQPPLRLLMS